MIMNTTSEMMTSRRRRRGAASEIAFLDDLAARVRRARQHDPGFAPAASRKRHSEDRIDHVVDERGDDLPDRGAENHGYRERQSVLLDEELLNSRIMVLSSFHAARLRSI